VGEESIDSAGALSAFYAAVDELNRRYGDSDDGPRLDTEELKPPRGVFLVARSNGDPVGGVGLRPIGAPVEGLGEVKRLWVRADSRRSGVATQLMNAVEEWSRQAGYRRLFLETGYAQPEALAFYPRSGWTLVDEFPAGVYSHPGATRFTKDL